MKRAAEAELGQKRQCRAAESLLTLRLEPPAPSLTQATDCSPASASSSSADDRQPAISRLSALERVGSDALVFILQCLTARHRLTVISRLSRAFYPLPALAFQRDSVTSVLPHASTWMRIDGTALPSRLSLRVKRAEQAGRWTLFTCPRSFRSLPRWSAVEFLSVELGLPSDADWRPSVRCLLRSVLSLPALQELVLSPARDGLARPEHAMDWTDSALPSSASLSRLTLHGLILSAASIRRLLSLPLQLLSLTDCRLLAGGDNAASSAELTAAGSSSSSSSSPTSLSLPNGAVRELRCRPLQRELLSIAASHAQQLRALDLSGCTTPLSGAPASELALLLTASGTPRLRQLTKLWLPKYSGSSRSDKRHTAASQQLVAAYSAQLTSLAVSLATESSASSWLRLVFGRCRQLQYFGFQRKEISISQFRKGPRLDVEPLELRMRPERAAEVLLLPSLTELHLSNLPLTDESLLSVLSCCPELVTCPMDALDYVTEDGLSAAFRCCPKLKR